MERAVWKSTPEAGTVPCPTVALPLLHPARGWGSVPDGPGEWVCSGSEGSWRFSSAQCGRLLLSPDLSTGNVGAAPHRAGAAHSSLLLRLV